MALRPSSIEPGLHTAVFDVNILLDIADLLGPPFTWDNFRAAATRNGLAPIGEQA